MWLAITTSKSAALPTPSPPSLRAMENDPAGRLSHGGTMQIRLTVTEGQHQGRLFTFSGHDTFLVGRSKHAHFRLPHKDRFFSRIHFLMEMNPPRCRLVDMGSRNGTFVNGKKVAAADLRDGDIISAGHTVM